MVAFGIINALEKDECCERRMPKMNDLIVESSSGTRRPTMMIYRVADLWLNRAGKWPRLEGLYSIKS